MRDLAIALPTLTLVVACMLPVPSQAQSNCSGLGDCRFDKIAVVRCQTDSDGGIRVRNSSVTSAVGVTVQRGARCGGTVSALLQSGLRLAARPTVTPSAADAEVNFNFIFATSYGSDDDGLYVDDDDDDDNDDNDDDDDDDD